MFLQLLSKLIEIGFMLSLNIFQSIGFIHINLHRTTPQIKRWLEIEKC